MTTKSLFFTLNFLFILSSTIDCSLLLDGESNPFKIDAGLALLENTNPPSVLSNYPGDGMTGIKEDSSVILSFSRDMNHNYTENAFSLTNSGAKVDGKFNWLWNTLYFTPNSLLNKSGLYTYTIQKTRAESSNGINLLDDFRASFSFSSDTSSPTLRSTIPANGASGVSPTTSITLEFSESMDTSTILSSITISPTATINLSSTIVSNDNKTFQFFLNQQLNYGTTYTVTIPNTVKDMVGNSLLQSYSISFNVGSDFDRPSISSIYTTSVANFKSKEYIIVNGFEKDESINISFSEAVQPALLQNAISFNPSVEFTVTDISGTNQTFSITPKSTLTINEIYQMKIATSIKDFQNNSLDKEYVYFPKINGPKSKWIQLRGVYGNAYNTTVANDFGALLFTDRINQTSPPLNNCVAVSECDQNLFIHFCWGDSTASCVYPLIQPGPPYGRIIPSSLQLSIEREFSGSIVGANSEFWTTLTNSTPIFPQDIFVYSTTLRFLDRDSTYLLTIKGGSSGVRDNLGNYMQEDYKIRFKFP
jgi:hypothetical protein